MLLKRTARDPQPHGSGACFRQFTAADCWIRTGFVLDPFRTPVSLPCSQNMAPSRGIRIELLITPPPIVPRYREKRADLVSYGS